MSTPFPLSNSGSRGQSAAGERPVRSQRWRVLIVDDDPDDRSNMRQLPLRGADRQYVFAEADRGDQALALIRNAEGERDDPKPFDCVILDFNLPDMNALELLTALNAGRTLPPCPIVVITGWDGVSGEEGARLLRAGAQDYIGKGWTTAESLNRSIENSIERFEMQTKRSIAEAALRESEERRKQSEVKLIAQADALAEADRRKDEFLAMLGHELRNPLAPLLSAAQILKLQPREEARHAQAVQVIDRQVGQLTRLVEDLLDVSRFTTGMFQLRLEKCKISEVVERAVATTRSLVAQRAHVLTVSLPEQERYLYADAARLEQVVVNLLTNAVKYSDAGGSIWVTVKEEGDMVVLRVRDTGIGIAPDLLPRIFELFSQAEQSLDRSEGGLGVGLCLVQRLIEQHQGRIEVFSTLGHGSEFVVRLPLMTEVAERSALPSMPTPDAVRGDHRVRILVVDDNIDAAETLGMLLTAAGQQVWLAHDGEAALTMALAHPPQVVLLDIGLPLLDGYEVAQRLRRQEGLANVVIVGITGYGHKSDRELSTGAGFDHHLLKPVDLNAVKKIVAAVVP